MLAEMKRLVRAKNMCVLATIAGDRPRCSLMAYSSNEECTEIYMATQGSTKKFRNLSGNPAVSLMIDSRDEVSRSQDWALTVEGTCVRIDDDARKQVAKSRLMAIHPQLCDFLAYLDTEMLCVSVRSFLLLKGLTDAHHVTLG